MTKNNIFTFELNYHNMNNVRSAVERYTLHYKKEDKNLYDEVLSIYNQCEEFFKNTTWEQRLTGTKLILTADVTVLKKICNYVYQLAKRTENMLYISDYYSIKSLLN